MTLLHFDSHHPLRCKEGIIYSQALWCNMIISEDHILQEELNNLTRILLARAYLLHLIIKNIKQALIHNRNHLLSQRTPQTESNILAIANYSQLIYMGIGTMLPMILHSPPFRHPNSYQSIPNPAVFITTLFTLHKHLTPHGRIPNTTTHTHAYVNINIPTMIYPWRYNHNGYTCFLNFGHT